MTVFFDLGVIEKEAGNNLKKFMKLFQVSCTNELPSRHKDSLYKKRLCLTGASFIINPIPLLNIRNIDIAYVVQYIKLAAKRDYTMYKYFSVKYLLLSYFPDINIEKIRSNPLLKITKDKIFFLYEELQKEKIWH